MAKYSHLYLITLLIGVFGLVISQDAPVVSGSYRAVGEMVYLNLGFLYQVYFEEDFDNKLGKSAFVVNSAEYNESFFEDTKTGKTWRIDKEGCVQYDGSDWQTEHIPPDLKLYETKDGKPMFPIRQLLNLRKEHQIPSTRETVTFRDITTRIYEYEIKDSNATTLTTKIKAYWSDGSMTSPSKYTAVPVAFEIQIWKDGKNVRNQSISLHMFFQGDESYHEFEPVRGVFCPGLQEDSMFREQIKKMTTFSFSSEIVETDFVDISSLDVWMVPGNKLYRQDLTAMDELWVESPIRLSRIASLKQGSGTVYEIRERFGGEYRCDVKGMNDLKFEEETIVAHQNAHDIEALFGFDSTKYYIVGKVKERGVTCQLYHGLRTDWPPSSKGVTTLWEWCIIKQTDDAQVQFEEEHFPLVSLRIYVTESPFAAETATVSYYKGQKYTHHFYNLHSYPNNVLETKIFDISPCFTDEQIQVLQLLISTSADTHTALKDDINNVDFIAMWKSAIYSASGLKPESLRVSKPVLDFTSSNMTVTFHVMDRHQNITEEVEPITLTEAASNIKNAVNSGTLSVQYKAKSGETFDLKAKSLVRRETFDPNKDSEPDNGYSAGTMAGVAIVMLIVGGAVGAAIFVLKKKYFDTPR